MTDSDVRIEIVDDVATYIELKSKRQATLHLEVKNVSSETWRSFTMQEVEVIDLGMVIISKTDVVRNFAPGESQIIEADIILPPNIPFAFDDEADTKIKFRYTFAVTNLMTKEEFDALPEWV